MARVQSTADEEAITLRSICMRLVCLPVRTIGLVFRFVFASADRTFVGFWFMGLLNNAGYVIMNSLAKDILPDAVAWVYVCNVLPTLFIKTSAPYWFHLVSYSTRVKLCATFLVLCFSVVGLFSSIEMQLFGVALGACASGLGEPTILAYSAHFDGRYTLTAWSSGTGFAGVFGYTWTLFFRKLLGFSQFKTVLIANILPLCWLIAFTILARSSNLSKRDSNYSMLAEGHEEESTDECTSLTRNSNQSQQQQLQSHSERLARLEAAAHQSTSINELNMEQTRTSGIFTNDQQEITENRANEIRASSAKASANRVSADITSGNADGRHTDNNDVTLSSDERASGGIHRGGDSGEHLQMDVDVGVDGADRFVERRGIDGLSSEVEVEDIDVELEVEVEKDPLKWTTKERMKFVLSMWPCTVPLFVVYSTEYALQSGTWAAIGFPSTSAAARADFYLYANWCYQLGVFVSRSSGLYFKANWSILWIMPVLQTCFLIFFTYDAVAHFWWNYALLAPAFCVGLLGGAVYVQAYILTSEKFAKESKAHQELALASVGVADTLGILVANFSGVWIQRCLYAANGIVPEGKPGAFDVMLDLPGNTSTSWCG